MRPALLNPLFAPVTSLAGVGPKQDRLFRYLLGREETPRLVDLLLHLPASVIDRRARPKIRDAVPGTVVTLEVIADRHRPPPPRNRASAAEAPRSARMDQPGSDPALQVSAGPGSAHQSPYPGRTHRHFAGWSVLVAARLRRTAGRSIGFGAGPRPTTPSGRGSPRRRRAPAQPHHRCPALRAHRLATQCG